MGSFHKIRTDQPVIIFLMVKNAPLQHRATLCFLLILGLIFELWIHNLGVMALSSDEGATGLMADMAWGGIHRQNEDSPHLPAYNLIMRAWRLMTGGSSEWLIRFPSVLMGVVLLALVYRAGWALNLGGWGSLIAVSLVGLNPEITLHVREARPYALMVMSALGFAVSALLFTGRRSKLIIAGGTALLALFSHYFTSFFVGAIALWRALTLTGRARREWIVAHSLVWASWIIWIVLRGRAFLNPTSLSTGKTWSLIMPPWDTFLWLGRIGAVGYREAATSYWGYVGAGLLFGLWLIGCWRARDGQRWFFMVLVALPLSAYAALETLRPVFHGKFMLPWLVITALAASAWVVKQPRWGGGITLALAFVMLGPTARTLQQPYDPGVFAGADLSAGPHLLTQEVLSLAGPQDVFGLGTPDPVHCYYFKNFFDRHLDCALLPKYPTQTSAELAQQVTDLMTTHSVLWYLDFHNPSWDPQQIIYPVLDQTTLPLGETDLAGYRLRLYTSARAVLEQQTPVGARFGAVARLEGLWVLRERALRLVLIWRSLADRPAFDGKIFLHLVAADGSLVAQADSQPVSWTRPFNTWQADEQLLDVHSLSLPPDTDLSQLTLNIGLYDAATLVRLPVADAAGRAQDQDQLVLPSGQWQPH